MDAELQILFSRILDNKKNKCMNNKLGTLLILFFLRNTYLQSQKASYSYTVLINFFLDY